MHFEERKLRVNGIDMNVVVAGKAPDPLLVHGYPDTHHVLAQADTHAQGAGFNPLLLDYLK